MFVLCPNFSYSIPCFFFHFIPCFFFHFIEFWFFVAWFVCFGSFFCPLCFWKLSLVIILGYVSEWHILLVFLLSENNFLGYDILDWQFFPFSAWCICHLLLTWVALMMGNVPSFDLLFGFVGITVLLSRPPRLSFSPFPFWNLSIICLVTFLWIYSVWNSFSFLTLFIFYHYIRQLSIILSLNVFLLFSSDDKNARLSVTVFSFLRLFSFSIFSLSSLCSEWVISTTTFRSLPIV